jgi:hypothetical protein
VDDCGRVEGDVINKRPSAVREADFNDEFGMRLLAWPFARVFPGLVPMILSSVTDIPGAKVALQTDKRRPG